jgi:DNA-binding NtrC family response regulator
MAKRILIVDDDADIRDASRMILEYEGYAVSAAAEGQAALAELDANRLRPSSSTSRCPAWTGSRCRPHRRARGRASVPDLGARR